MTAQEMPTPAEQFAEIVGRPRAYFALYQPDYPRRPDTSELSPAEQLAELVAPSQPHQTDEGVTA